MLYYSQKEGNKEHHEREDNTMFATTEKKKVYSKTFEHKGQMINYLNKLKASVRSGKLAMAWAEVNERGYCCFWIYA